MAQEIKLLKIYNTPKGKLRAIINYAGSNHTLKLDISKTGKVSSSFISMPIGCMSFEVSGISNCDTDQSVTLNLLRGASFHSQIRLDLVESQFI